jgi:hypothetical protein
MAAVMVDTSDGLSRAHIGRRIQASELLVQGRVGPLASARRLRARRSHAFQTPFYPSLGSFFVPGGYASRLDPPTDGLTGSSLFHVKRSLP